ncbi:MAG: DNA-binding protein, partial [Candidatus Neomarinimicrobiota bacterium]
RFKGTVFDVRGPFVNVESWWIPAEEKLQRDRL